MCIRDRTEVTGLGHFASLERCDGKRRDLSGPYGNKRSACGKDQAVQIESRISCPGCGHQAVEIMPTDACRFFYDCKGCGVRLKPKAGDCCVYCSFGSVPCPPIQQNGKCCG